MPSQRQLFLDHIGQTSPAPLMLEIERAEGSFLYDRQGRDYLDLISGVSVSNTGHRHPAVMNALHEQAGRYMHLMVYGEVIQSPQVQYAAMLASLLPPPLESVYFVNSGSEAIEGAIKLARRYTGRNEIIYFRNAYHGSTTGALSVQGSELYRNAFRPLMPATTMAEFNSPDAVSLISNATAAVLVEPVQAEAGVIQPSGSFLNDLRDACTRNGSLLIFDEVQTGFGRTGSLFSLFRYDVIPDILVLAKALGGGLPLGAFIASRNIMSSLTHDPALGHITTFGGHPLCCATGMASLEVIVREKLAEQALEKEQMLRAELAGLPFREIRGEGLLLAAEPEKPEIVPALITNAPAHGLLLDYFLFCPTAFRIAPPLTISEDEIHLACRRLGTLIKAAGND
ncbi:MAG TPA: aspartate aminotransferase family protein [Bacteroidales bacterium]|nr:aspartate aminotransferase family protein [Bacteroidales bacterium]HPQ64976.1 aspartate aminotransferase family protein [Bacteroidales bacterium]HRW28281.1 aspartate aminotransferase family protein [Bacteroidales bacterium]